LNLCKYKGASKDGFIDVTLAEKSKIKLNEVMKLISLALVVDEFENEPPYLTYEVLRTDYINI
jgi:hypothetical protein